MRIEEELFCIDILFANSFDDEYVLWPETWKKVCTILFQVQK